MAHEQSFVFHLELTKNEGNLGGYIDQTVWIKYGN
jgi:hypothetical protein